MTPYGYIIAWDERTHSQTDKDIDTNMASDKMEFKSDTPEHSHKN